MLQALHKVTRCDLDGDKFHFAVDNYDMSFLGFKAIRKFKDYKASMTVNTLLDASRNGYKIQYSDTALSVRNILLGEYSAIKDAQKFKTMTDEEIEEAWEKADLYEKQSADTYQKRTILFGLAVKRALLMLEMGLGKSYIGATIAQNLVDAELVKPGEILIVAPLTLHTEDNWAGEMKKFSDMEIQTVESESDLLKDADVYIIGPERFRIMSQTKLGVYDRKNPIIRKGFKLIIFDESAKLKSGTSQITEIFHKYCNENHIPFIYLMTGLPAPNNVFQLWGQAAALGYWLGDTYSAFEARYGNQISITPTIKKYVPKPGAYEQIKERIDFVSIALTQAECLQLPPYTVETVYISLPDPQLKLYHQIENDYFCVIDQKNSSSAEERKMYADTEAAVRAKLLQIMNGFLITVDAYGEKHTSRLSWNPKLDTIKEILFKHLQDPSNHAIVWARFIEELTWLHEELSKYWLCAKGAGQSVMSKAEQQRNATMFKNDPNCRVMVAHPGAFMYGHTWNKANLTIYSSAPDDHEHYSQSRKRNHRRGQTRPVTEIRIVAEKTLESKIWYAMEHKKRLDEFLKARR